MRLGVLDVGSNTVHLLVVDAHPGARPIPSTSHKAELRLAERLAHDGSIDPGGADALVAFVTEAAAIAEDQGVEDLMAFATSAIREAPNGEMVLGRVFSETGVELEVLSGEDEARLTFLAARRWCGWSAGRLLLLDIGGGSLELAGGGDEEPDVCVSLPLGAGRLTREWFATDPPRPAEVAALRKHVRAEVARHVRAVRVAGTPDRVVATSKTFRQLARVLGAAPSSAGPYTARTIDADRLARQVPLLAAMTSQQRAVLPGVSAGRAPQLVAGAIVADAAMDLFGVARLQVCPWALREGLILRRLDWLRDL